MFSKKKSKATEAKEYIKARDAKIKNLVFGSLRDDATENRGSRGKGGKGGRGNRGRGDNYAGKGGIKGVRQDTAAASRQSNGFKGDSIVKNGARTAKGAGVSGDVAKSGSVQFELINPAILSFPQQVSDLVSKLLEEPQVFLSTQEATLSNTLRNSLKELYDYGKRIESETHKQKSFNQLIVQDFDEEQIWEELQQHNVPLLKLLSSIVNGIVADSSNVIFDINPNKKASIEQSVEDEIENKNIDNDGDAFDDYESEDDENVDNYDDFDDQEGSDEDGEDIDDRDEDFDDNNEPAMDEQLDSENEDSKDKFFNIDDLEDWLDKQDQAGDEDVDGEDDMDDEDEDDNKPIKYEDFFDDPNAAQSGHDEFELPEEMFEDDDVDEEGEEVKTESNLGQLRQKLQLMEEEEDKQSQSNLSVYQKRMEKLRKQIEQLESQNVAEKPWALRGEISSKERPLNSLLEVILDYDNTAKPAPQITEETTLTIEDLIKKRIKEGSWDDVIRKIPVEKKAKERIELPSEKSKIGLAEVYEKEFIKKTTGYSQEDEKKTQEQKEVLKLFRQICYRLDQLANFHYTPTPDLAMKEKKKRPSLQMEDRLPMTMSNTDTVAPEQVYAKKSREVKGETELTQEDRKKGRKRKKVVNQRKNKEKEAHLRLKKKLNPDSLPTKDQAEKKLKENKQKNTILAPSSGHNTTTSTTELFKQLQNEAAGVITRNAKRTQDTKNKKTSSQLKL